MRMRILNSTENPIQIFHLMGKQWEKIKFFITCLKEKVSGKLGVDESSLQNV